MTILNAQQDRSFKTQRGRRFRQFFFAQCLFFTLSACTKMSITATGREIAAVRDAKAPVFVTRAQDTTPDTLSRDPKGRIHTNSRTLKFEGTCTRGVLAAVVLRGSERLGEEAACDAAGKFSWSYRFEEDLHTELKLFAKMTSGLTQVGGTTQWVVDTVAPNAPFVTTNLGEDFYGNRQIVALEGWTPNETATLETVTGSTGLVYTPAADPVMKGASDLPFGYQIQIAEGQTRHLSFVAVDYAGNRSSPSRIGVSNLARANLRFSAHSGAAIHRPMGTAGGVEFLTASLVPWVAPAQPINSWNGSADGELRLSTGVQSIATDVD
jgi:hypothetical protein